MPYDWRNLDPSTALSAENLEASAQVTLAEAQAYADRLPGRFRGDYAAGDYGANDIVVVNNDTLYYAPTDMTVGDVFDPQEWQQVPIGQAGISPDLLGAPGGIPTLTPAGTIDPQFMPAGSATTAVVQTWSLPGDLAVGTGVIEFEMPTNGIIQDIRARAQPPDGQSIIFDVNANGTSLYTNQAARPTIPVGGRRSGGTVPAVTAVAKDTPITIDVDQVGIQPAGGAQTPTLRSDTSEVTVTAVTAVTANRPAGIQAGDWHLIEVRGSNADLSTPAGLTKLVPFVNASTPTSFYARMDDGTAAGPWTFTSATSMASVFVNHKVYPGVDPAAPVDAAVAQVFGTSTTVTPSALTTLSANALVAEDLWLGASRSAAAPAGYTPRSAFNGTAGTQTRRHLADKIQAAAGPVDVGAITIGSTGTNGLLLRFALKPVVIPPQAVWSPGRNGSVIMRYVETA